MTLKIKYAELDVGSCVNIEPKVNEWLRGWRITRILSIDVIEDVADEYTVYITGEIHE